MHTYSCKIAIQKAPTHPKSMHVSPPKNNNTIKDVLEKTATRDPRL